MTMEETLTNDGSGKVTGDVVVDLSAVPTEYLVDSETKSTGYTFTHFSSSATALSSASSSTVQVVFQFPAPGYFYQVKSVAKTTTLAFIVGLVALAGAALSIGSVFASISALLYTRIQASRTSVESPDSNTQIKEVPERETPEKV